MTNPEAIIADDEAQLIVSLTSKLSQLWPDLVIRGQASNGVDALKLIETYTPDIAFLDIKMPGLSGIEVAQKIGVNCRVVFVTAYDQFAIEAFENEALDYLLKPVTDERLSKTIQRLKKQIGDISSSQADVLQRMNRLLAAIPDRPHVEYLKWIKVRQGDKLRLISVDEIYYFRSEDKYTMVKTIERESLIKKGIQQLSDALDPAHFWRIHRSTIINVSRISEVTRSFAGRYIVKLQDLPETLTVSRTYAHLFKQM